MLLVLLCLFIAGCDEDCDPIVIIVMLFTRIMGGDAIYPDSRALPRSDYQNQGIMPEIHFMIGNNYQQ